MKKLIAPLGFFIFLLILWEAIIVFFNVPKYIIPSLGDILQSFKLGYTHIAQNVLVTFLESLAGLVAGSLIAITFGILMAQFRLFSRISLPYLIASNAIPVIAVAPILILWFGNGMTSKVVVAGFLCFFPLCMNTFKGLNDYDKSYENLFRLYGGSKWDFLWRFKFYNARHYLITGFKLNASFCVIGAIVAEIISSNKGLGFGILQATYSLNVPLLWCYIIISCLLGLVFYCVVAIIEFIYFKK